jgi:putative FmdB family regulatory protein
LGGKVPTYQYACRGCGERLEIVQRFTDDPLTECPSCAGQLRKVFSPVGIVFKGSGFYRTDSRPAAKDGTGSADGKTPDKASKASKEAESASSTGKPAAKESAKESVGPAGRSETAA